MKGRASFGAASAAAWQPSERELSRSRLAGAMRRWGFDDIADLHRHSVDEPEAFWRAALEDLGIAFSTPWIRLADTSAGYEFPRWFTGGKLNVAFNCVERHAADPAAAARAAVIYEGDSGARREMSFARMGAEVERVAAGLRALGIAKGDRVGLFLPVIPEAAVALLACAKIGAVGVPAFSGYGPEPLAARLNAAEVAALVTVDGTSRRGQRVAMKDIADTALDLAPGVRHLIVIDHDAGPTTRQPRDIGWAGLGQGLAPVPTEACDPNDPFLIIYTSGTTGAPKGIVH